MFLQMAPSRLRRELAEARSSGAWGLRGGSSVERLRPVGRTSAGRDAASRPGRAATKRPSSARSRFSRSLRAEAGSISRMAEDMQPLTEGQFGDVAEMGVEPRQRVAHVKSPGSTPQEAASPLASARARISVATNRPGADRAPAPVRTPRRGRAAARSPPAASASTSGGGRWPSVTAESRRLAEARLAGVIDDIGIDHRKPANSEARPAAGRQRNRLARQPLGRAVRPEMDQGVDARSRAGPR